MVGRTTTEYETAICLFEFVAVHRVIEEVGKVRNEIESITQPIRGDSGCLPDDAVRCQSADAL